MVIPCNILHPLENIKESSLCINSVKANKAREKNNVSNRIQCFFLKERSHTYVYSNIYKPKKNKTPLHRYVPTCE